MNINLSPANMRAYLNILHKGKTQSEDTGESSEKFVGMVAAATEGKEVEKTKTAMESSATEEVSGEHDDSTANGGETELSEEDGADETVDADRAPWKELDSIHGRTSFVELFAGFRDDEPRFAQF